MSLVTRNGLSLTITIGGQSVPEIRFFEVSYLHMGCSTRLGIPTLHMKVNDTSDFLLTNNLLYDGSPIDITIGIPEIGINSYSFLLSSFTPSPDSMQHLEIEGYLAFPSYWNLTSIEPISGTSYTALGSIANKTGLKYLGTPTSDTQIWYPNNRYLHTFARDIADHGYSDSYSCLLLGIDLEGYMIYKNISASNSSITNISLGLAKPGFLLATKGSFTYKTGSLNHISGYSSSILLQDSVNPTYNKVRKSVSLKGSHSSRTLQLNSDIKSTTSSSSGRTILTPINSGNVHPYYEEAKYQNSRIAALHTIKAELILPMPSNIKILDSVNLLVASDVRPQYKDYSGSYIVSSRVIFTEGNSYFEKLELLSKSASLSSNSVVSS